MIEFTNASRQNHDVLEHVRGLVRSAGHENPSREMPFVTLTYAQSLDGCIARTRGAALQLSNPRSRLLTHQLRAMHDAILVGINTVLADDPQLTVRLVKGKSPQPIVVDSRLRFPLTARLLAPSCARPLIVTTREACPKREQELSSAGARVLRLASQEDGRVDIPEMLAQLKTLGIRSVMVEGGAEIITSVLAGRLADQLVLTISPTLVGGVHAIHPSRSMTGDIELPRLSNLHFQSMDGDVIVRADLECKSSARRDGRSLAMSVA